LTRSHHIGGCRARPQKASRRPRSRPAEEAPWPPEPALARPEPLSAAVDDGIPFSDVPAPDGYDPDPPFRYSDLAPFFREEPQNEAAARIRDRFVEHLRGAIAYERSRIERLERRLAERRRQSLKVIEGGKP
jgi:hypothetical protein